MRFFQNAALAACGMLVAGCAQINVSEAVLSTNKKVAMGLYARRFGFPPANLVLLADRGGPYVPVATGFGPAPVPALLNGAGAGVAIGAGIYGAAKVSKPSVRNNNTTTSSNSITQSGSGLSTGPQTSSTSSTTTQTSQ